MRVRLHDRDGFFIAGDALRGFMCSVIVLVHAYLGLAGNVAGFGRGFEARAVELGSICMFSFFVLSGYLVGGPFARRFVEGRELLSVRRYAAKRARRVLPAFWLILTLFILWFGTFGASAVDAAWMYLFQQNQHPSQLQLIMVQAWTLDIEVAFYVLLPIVAWLAVRLWGARGTVTGRRAAVLALLALTFAGSFLAHYRHPATNQPTTSIITFWWAIAPGVALAVLETPLREWLALRPGLGRRIGGAFLAGAVLLIVVIIVLDPVPASAQIFSVQIAAAVGFVAGAMAWQWDVGRAPAFFEFRPFHALGRWSYSMYLLHIGIGREMLGRLPDGASDATLFALMGGVMLVVSVAGGALLWWLVEEPALTGRRPGRPAFLAARREEPSATLP